MVALVTGAQGFIGGHAAARLRADGWSVVGAGRPEVELASNAFDELLADTCPDVVVHCAGPASVQMSIEDPAADRAGSVGVVERLAAGILALPAPPRLVLLSSAAVYGQPDALPIAEDHPLRPVSPYGEHRVACEELVRARCAHDGLRAVCLRVFSAYGPGLRRQLLWDICRRAAQGDEVELAGTGEESRDFGHVTDVAAAVAAATGAPGWDGDPYNVGSGAQTTVREVAERLLERTGVALSFTGLRRPGDPPHWRADTTALERLGFESAVPFAEGARAYAQWAADQLRGVVAR